MQNFHAVVWLDHREARIFFVDRNASAELDVASKAPKAHLHHKAGSISGKRSADDQNFLNDIVKALAPAQEWLIMGPGSAKTEFVKHVHRHEPRLADHIIGVETSDHPTDPQIVAHARAYFRDKDHMRPDPRG